MKLDIDKIIFEAPVEKSFAALARRFEMDVSTMRYRLMKERKLEFVKQVIFWATDGKRFKMKKREMNASSEVEKFNSRYIVNPTSNCWEWVGTIRPNGYGVMYIKKERLKLAYAHRVAWSIFHGELIPGMVIDHQCRNRRCVNPQHLRQVTPKVNATENSLSVSAVNAQKSFCKNGHEFSIENTYHRPDGGGRCCKKCIMKRLAENPRFETAEQIKARAQRYYKKNKQKILERCREYRRKKKCLNMH